MKVEVEFPVSWSAEGNSPPMPIHLGRLAVKGGIVRIAFMPDGRLSLFVPQSAVTAGGVKIYDDQLRDDEILGFGLTRGPG